MNATKDRGGEAPQWVICTEVGGLSFLHEVKNHEKFGSGAEHVPVFCASLDKAKRFATLGELMEVLAMLPARMEAYEEDPRFLQ